MAGLVVANQKNSNNDNNSNYSMPQVGICKTLTFFRFKDIVKIYSYVNKEWYDSTRSPVVWMLLLQRYWSQLSYVPKHLKDGLMILSPENRCRIRKEINNNSKNNKENNHHSNNDIYQNNTNSVGNNLINIFKNTIKDTKRNVLTLEELTSFHWNFRFKKAAGHGWYSQDPYWSSSKECIKIKFNRDGTTTRSLGGNTIWTEVSVTWRWGNSDTREPGSGTPCNFLRATVEGRDVPRYILSRHPVHKGFILQSCWTVYTSFEMPKLGTDPYMDDEALNLNYKEQGTEVLAYNSGIYDDENDIEITVQEESAETIIIEFGPLQFRLPHLIASHLIDLPREQLFPIVRSMVRNYLERQNNDLEEEEDDDDEGGDDEGDSDVEMENGDMEVVVDDNEIVGNMMHSIGTLVGIVDGDNDDGNENGLEEVEEEEEEEEEEEDLDAFD